MLATVMVTRMLSRHNIFTKFVFIFTTD